MLHDLQNGPDGSITIPADVLSEVNSNGNADLNTPSGTTRLNRQPELVEDRLWQALTPEEWVKDFENWVKSFPKSAAHLSNEDLRSENMYD
jgi:hypothetical protein